MILPALQSIVAPLHGVVLLSGSRGADVHDEERSDIDLVIIVPSDESYTASFDAVADAIEQSCLAPSGAVQVLRHAYTPVIKLTGALQVDVIVACVPRAHWIEPDVWYTCWNTRTLPAALDTVAEHMDEMSMRAINALRVCALFSRQSCRMKRVMRAVRAWARAHGVYGTQLGFWGGVAWSLFCLYKRASTLDQVLTHVVTHAWPQPLGRDDASVTPAHDDTTICSIMTPVQPCMNATYTCNVITLREMILQAEDTLANRRPTTQHHHRVHIVIESAMHADFVMMRARQLAITLERPDVYVRPRAQFTDRVMTWGLQTLQHVWTPELVDELEKDVREWCARVAASGVTVMAHIE